MLVKAECHLSDYCNNDSVQKIVIMLKSKRNRKVSFVRCHCMKVPGMLFYCCLSV